MTSPHGDDLPSVSLRDFAATIAAEPSSLRVTLNGTADLLAREKLETFLEGLHAQATSRRVTRVLVDVNGLGFINSACLKCLVTWIFEVHAADRRDQYHIVFLTNRATPWQERSFHAIASMCTELVSTEG